MNKIEKPITVLREDFIRDLNNVINNSGIPPIIMEPILKDMHMDIYMVLQKQTEFERQKYNEALMNQAQEENEAENDTDNAQ